MESGAPFFWMNGLLATGLLEVTSDAERLNDGGFWATSITFEGERTFAKFATVLRDQPFPESPEWKSIRSIWKSSLSREQYYDYVEDIRKHISFGDVYQANACRVLSTPSRGTSLDSLFAKLLENHFAPYASFLRLPDIEIASATPELFLRREGETITTSPIKGTQDFTSRDLFGSKDQSENIMIVDLMRNDLSQICEIGSIKVTDFLRIEHHPGIRHLVSDVQGTLRTGISWDEILHELLPAGSVSGAPKHSALQIIQSNEPTPRGVYCGLMGWIQGSESVLGLAIRTFWNADRTLYFGTGAGITWPSDPHLEWRETELKANRLVGIAGGIDDEGWQYGSGIFETILMIDNRPLFFDRHMDRAEASGRELGIDIPPREDILRAISYLARFPMARLRLSFGSQFSLSAAPYEQKALPLRVQIRDQRLIAGIGSHKKYPYWENLDLVRAAQFDGFSEVLLIDEWGRVGEGATCNYLFYLDGQWITPPLSVGVLPGVMRSIALDKGLAIEKELLRSDLPRVKSMVALSSLRIAALVTRLMDRTLDIGMESELIFQSLWSEAQSDSVG